MNKIIQNWGVDSVLRAVSVPAVRDAIFQKVSQREGAHIVEGDFFNLGNVNSVLGRDQTNQFMKVLTSIVYEELDAVSQGELYISRLDQSDEISFFLSGGSQDEINSALRAAQEKIDEFVTDVGLTQLQHRKYLNLSGSGLRLASQKITEESDYSIVSSTLQTTISDEKQKNTEPVEGVIKVGSFPITPTDMKFKREISNKWQPYLDKKYNLPDSLMSGFSIAKTVRKSSVLRGRNQREADIKNINFSEQDYSYMRLDLANLSGLNSILGQDNANAIRDKLRGIAIEQTHSIFSDAQFYEVGSGSIDVIIPTRDSNQIAVLKNSIHSEVFDAILSKACLEFIVSEGTVAEEFKALQIGDLPHTDDPFRGVGWIMADTPIMDNHNMAALYERVDCSVAVLKTHNIAFVEGGGNSVTAHHIGRDQSEVLPNREPSVENILPWAHSLQGLLTPEKIIKIMNKPVGMITQQLFGRDLSEPLQRQQAMKHLMQSVAATTTDEARKVIEEEVQSEILKHVSTKGEFDQWIEEEHPDFDAGRLTLLDRPEIHTWLDESLMTMNLSTRWGFVTEEIKNIVLEGQLTARIAANVIQGGTTNKVEDSINMCAYAIRTGFEGEKDIEAKTVQFAKETSDMLVQIQNIKGNSGVLDEETSTALVSIIRSSSKVIARKCENMDEQAIAEAFEALPSHAKMTDYPDQPNPISILAQKLDGAITFIQENQEIEPSLKVKILAKIQGLKVVSDSFDAPFNHGAPQPRNNVAQTLGQP